MTRLTLLRTPLFLGLFAACAALGAALLACEQPVPTATATQISTATSTATTAPKDTPVPVSLVAPTSVPKATPTVTPSSTDTATPLPTDTPTSLPTETPTPVPTDTPTPAPTATVIDTPTPVYTDTPTATPTATPKDWAALFELYEASGGPNWLNNTHWLSATPIEYWHGVVTDEHGSITELQLRGNGLNGEIPGELGNLTDLKVLRLEENDLRGEIPPELGDLANLETLILFENELIGEIPPSLGDLSNLSLLVLAKNRLSGEIPPELAQLSKLQGLFLHENLLEGTIPSDFAALSNLAQLRLDGNQLNGEIPPELARLTNLQLLNLKENHLSGVIPPELGALLKLKTLDLNANQFSGEIPAELGELPYLEVLLIAGNDELAGCIPDSLRDVRDNDLSYLELPFCSVVAAKRALEPERAALVAIYDATDGPNWHNSRNWLSDASVGEWHGVRTNSNGRVVALDLVDNNLSGEIPPEIERLSELTWLRLDGNGLRGVIPPEIGSLSKLDALLLTFNELEGELPGELASLSNLSVFSVGQNRLTGSIPSWIGDLTNLERIVLFQNQFSGEIPAAFGDLGNLVLLRLNDNKLSGKIPTALGALSRLEWLEISNNQLTGEIPVELAGLSNLTDLILYRNRLSGEVPSELGRLANLRNLRFDFNRFTGSIPPELGNLSMLENLELLDNQLSGEIPPEIGEISNLTQLFVSRNSGLTGCFHDGLLDIESNDFYDVDLESCSQAERDALAMMYERTDGANWINGDGWLTDAPLDEWYGVTTDEYGRVVGIDLVENNLNGEISNALGKLAKLETLRLTGNAITGCVPISLANLPTNDFGDSMLNECSVHFPDNWLKSAMLERLGMEPGSEIYASDLSVLEHLNLSWSYIRDLEGLQHATNLRRLTLGESRPTPRPDEESYPNTIENLAPLAHLTNLTELNLAHCELTNIVALSSLTNLEHLDVGFNRLHHLEPIANLNKLESLLASNNHVEDVENLSDLSSLTRLDLSDNKFSDIAPLAGLERLQELDISYNELFDLAPVSRLEQLLRLEIKGIGVEDLSPIEDLSRLTHLDASWNVVNDLSPLRGLTALNTLKLGPAPISDISVLSDFVELEQLRIVGTEVTDISPLRDLKNLRSVVLSDNRISDVGPLAGLGDLAILDLNFNQIEDVSPLVELSELDDLRLNGNRIGDLEPLVENQGLSDSDRLELDANILDFGANRRLAVRLTDRGVDVEFDALYATAFGQPQIYGDNAFVLPIGENLLSANLRLEDYANDFYENFRDEFDFLMVISNVELFDDLSRRYSGGYLGVSNDVEGIGIDKFHNDEWGSDGRLQGVLHFPWKGGLGGGPVLHELMHRWGNRVVEPYPHWWFSSVNGQLGGFGVDTLVDLGGGRYTAWFFGPGGRSGDGDPYSVLELYLAGLAPAEEVPDWIVGVDAGWSFGPDGRVEEYEDRGHVFTVGEFKTYSIDDIIATHGPRAPGFSASQKEFRAAAILLVDEDHPATPKVVEEISHQVSRFSHRGDDEEWEYNFYEATRGRGTMLMGDLPTFRKEGQAE